MTSRDTPPALTPTQQRVLAVVDEWIDTYGYPPTVREIGTVVKLRSPSSVAHHLKTLQGLGLLRRGAGARALQSLPRGGPDLEGSARRVPVLGSIAAGVPLLAEQHVEDELDLPVSMVGRGTVFALTVRGDSMVDAAICDGDVAVFRQQPTAESGEIVAAMIGDGATVKQLRIRGGHVELVPHNPRFDVIPADDAVILGKLRCVIRRVR